MAVFEIVIALLLGGAILAAIARRVSLPYPALVAIAGAALALFPRVPTLVLDPELALALFVAPVLLDSAFDASQRDLRKNWRTVAGLAIGAVVLTVVFVAVVAHALVPSLPWTAAIALGAIVRRRMPRPRRRSSNNYGRRIVFWSSSRAKASSTMPARC